MNRMDGPSSDSLLLRAVLWASRFLGQARGEAAAVVWPKRRALLTYAAVVLLFAGTLTLVVLLLDLVFARLSG
jgi:preprotein translocase SecE subunit